MKKSILCTALSIFCLFGCNRTKIKEVKKSEAESFVKETYTLENAKSKYDPDTTKTVEDINGDKFTYAKPFDEEVSAGMSRKIIYERTINKSDRATRPTGA